MEADTTNFQQVFQLRLELLKAVDEISRLTSQPQLELPGVGLTAHNIESLVELMTQTLKAARITIHFITILVDDKTIKVSPEVNQETRTTYDLAGNIVHLEGEEEAGSTMRPDNISEPGSTRSPNRWCKSAFSAFENVPTTRKRDRRSLDASLEQDDENCNTSCSRLDNSCSRRRNYEDDDDVITNFLEPCIPCNKCESRAGSFLDTSVASIDTSNVNVRKKKRKKFGAGLSAETSLDDFNPNSLSLIDPADLSLSRLSGYDSSRLSTSGLPVQDTDSLASAGNSVPVCHLSSVSASGQLTPPVSENGQASPKSVDSDRAETDPTEIKHIPAGLLSASSDLPLPSSSSAQKSDKLLYHPYLTAAALSTTDIESDAKNSDVVNYFDYSDSSHNDQVLSYQTGEFVSRSHRSTRTSGSSRYSSSTPIASPSVPFNSRNSMGSAGTVTKQKATPAAVNTVEVISLLDSSSEDSCPGVLQEPATLTKPLQDPDYLKTSQALKESFEKIDILNKKYLDFSDVCKINVSSYDTPELLRGAESWIDWRFTPVETTRTLNTPLECSTPVTARPADDVNENCQAEEEKDKCTTPGFTYLKPDIIRRSYLRLTPARLKYSRSMKEIHQDKGRKLVILNDTRLPEATNVNKTEKPKTEKTLKKPAYKPLVTFQSESVLPNLGLSGSTPARKKTLSRSKASVSLAKTDDSPPSTPRRMGKSRQASRATILESLNEEASTQNKITYNVPDIELIKSPAKAIAASEVNIVESLTKEVDHSPIVKEAVIVKPGCSEPDSVSHLEMTKTEIPDNILKPLEQSELLDDKPRRKINFGKLNTFYFSRVQGWVGVPKEGGNTLGMNYNHFDQDERELGPEEEEEKIKTNYNLEYAQELERTPTKTPKIEYENCGVGLIGGGAYSMKLSGSGFYAGDNLEAVHSVTGTQLTDNISTSITARKMRASARSDSTPCLLDMGRSTGPGLGLGAAASSMLDLRAAIGARKKGESGTRGLYKISSKSRKGILKNSGIKDLDPMEALEIKVLRQSRMECGCSCTGECKPGVCECVDAGIQCHEEKSGFPCSCSFRCTNPQGIRRFDPLTVKMHHIQTMLTVQGALDIK